MMAMTAVLSPSAHNFEMSNFPFPSESPQQTRPKPKLQLNTVSVTSKKTLGRSTSLRLDTITASTPTSRNTYVNTFNSAEDLKAPDHGFKTARATTFTFETSPASPSSPPADSNSHRNSLPSQLLKRRRESAQIPYRLIPATRSILINGPLEKKRRLAASRALSIAPSSSSSSADASRSRPAKRVCFRDPMVEEIRNTVFLLKHSDLQSPLPSPTVAQVIAVEIQDDFSDDTVQPPPPRRREVAAKAHQADERDDYDGSRPPKTPVAGRSKKEREWTWTLGPLPGRPAETPDVPVLAAPKLEEEQEDEDLEQSLGESVAAAAGFSC